MTNHGKLKTPKQMDIEEGEDVPDPSLNATVDLQKVNTEVREGEAVIPLTSQLDPKGVDLSNVLIQLDVKSAQRRVAAKHGQLATSAESQEESGRETLFVEVHRDDVPPDDSLLGKTSPGTAMFLSRKRKKDQEKGGNLKKRAQKEQGQELIQEPTEGLSDKAGGKGKRLHKNVAKAAAVGQSDRVGEDNQPKEMEPWGAPGVLQGDWQVQTLGQTPNIRNLATVHVIAPSHHPMRCINTRKVDCFRVTAKIKATGSLVAVEVPCAAVSPAAIFRDIPELEPHFPPPVTTLN